MPLHNEYKLLSKKLHPDLHDGNHHKFTEMQNQYRDLLFYADNDKLPDKPQSEYYKRIKRHVRKKTRAKKVNLSKDVKAILKKELRKRVPNKKITVKREQTVYIVNVNDLLNGIIDRFF